MTPTYDLRQAVDHGVDGKTRGVHLDGALRTAQRCRLSFAVAAVAALDLAQDLGHVRLLAARAKLPRTPFDGRAALAALWDAKWEALLPFVLVGGLATGKLRIHEAAAFTALYVLVVETLVYKDLALKEIPRIIRESVTLVGAILFILATAIGFTAFFILRVNTRLLPPALRPRWYQRLGLAACGVFYLGLAALVFRQEQLPVLLDFLGID